ncbi:MAG: Mg-chelatase subunit ChlD [Acidobacteria bacterium]|nr:Mg-chelatase subunit ChlD [Acidobacteriota bacterium]
MKRNIFVILPLVLCGAFALAFFDLSAASAQNPTTNRQRQIPAPTPSPTPSVAPSVSPTPEVEEIIKIDTELVNLNVRVVDRNNRPVNNLSPKEFQIFEDNILQPIEFFSKSEVPTNYSLVIDNSGSLRMQLEKVIEAGKIIVNTNRADDETSVIRFISSDKIEIVQDFTPNKTDIIDALDNLYTEGGQTAIIDAVYLAAEKVTEYEKSRSDDRKRRALILVSDGEDRDSFYKEPQLFELLRESDVQIYTIGFVGELSKEGGFISKSPQSKAKALLERLATETGGKSYFPNSINELTTIAQDIASELRTQYSIGYIPTNDRRDGTFRNIKVQVADGPNKQKRIAVTRSGRTATPEGAPPSLQNTTKKSSE